MVREKWNLPVLNLVHNCAAIHKLWFSNRTTALSLSACVVLCSDVVKMCDLDGFAWVLAVWMEGKHKLTLTYTQKARAQAREKNNRAQLIPTKQPKLFRLNQPLTARMLSTILLIFLLFLSFFYFFKFSYTHTGLQFHLIIDVKFEISTLRVASKYFGIFFSLSISISIRFVMVSALDVYFMFHLFIYLFTCCKRKIERKKRKKNGLATRWTKWK